MIIKRTQVSAGYRAVGIIVAIAGVVVAGCNSDGLPDASKATGEHSLPGLSAPAPPSASPSPADLARVQAIAAYQGMWRNMAQAGITSDWRSPGLSQYATADALSAISRGMYADHLNGLITKGAPKTYPQVSSMDPPIDPTTVMIADCGDSTTWLKYRVDNGHLADNEPGGRQAITAELKKQADGSWKVTRFAVEGVGTCGG